jgi:hypothetical protein
MRPPTAQHCCHYSGRRRAGCLSNFECAFVQAAILFNYNAKNQLLRNDASDPPLPVRIGGKRQTEVNRTSVLRKGRSPTLPVIHQCMLFGSTLERSRCGRRRRIRKLHDDHVQEIDVAQAIIISSRVQSPASTTLAYACSC